MILKRLLFLAFVLPAPLTLAAQEAVIFAVEGRDFALTIRGGQTIIPAGDVSEEGVTLERTGIVNTGAGTFLEIRLLPSGTLIKVSENTSLAYNGIDETGKFADLGLLYGRIRVVVPAAAGLDTVGSSLAAVRSGGVSARMEEGDYGIDYVLEPDGASIRPVFRLSVFRGSADVSPYGRGGGQAYFGGAQKLSLGEGESLTLDISSSFTFAEKKVLDSGIVDYWTLHTFSAAAQVSPPQGAPQVLSTPGASASGPTEAGSVDFSGQADRGAASYTSGASKNVILALGLFLTVTSALVQGASFHIFDAPNNDAARTIYNAAYVPLGLGVLTTLTGILYNPSSSKR